MNVDEDTLRRIIRGELRGVETRLDTVDARLDSMDARFDSMDERFDAVDARFLTLELNLAGFFGKAQDYFNKKFNKFERRHNEQLKRLQSTLAGHIERMDDNDIERAAMSKQLGRHDTWIGELAQSTGTTLSTP